MISSALNDSWLPTRQQLITMSLFATLVFASGAIDTGGAIPFTLQMIPVLMVGLLLAPRQAMFTVAAAVLLLAVAVSAGRLPFTVGYMVGWMLAVGAMATLAGPLRQGQWQGWQAVAYAAMIGAAGYLVVWAAGWAWLAYGWPQFGPERALQAGVLPFLLGAPLKLAAAVAFVLVLTPPLRRFVR